MSAKSPDMKNKHGLFWRIKNMKTRKNSFGGLAGTM